MENKVIKSLAKNYCFRLDTECYDYIRKCSEDLGLSMSQFIMQMVMNKRPTYNEFVHAHKVLTYYSKINPDYKDFVAPLLSLLSADIKNYELAVPAKPADDSQLTFDS